MKDEWSTLKKLMFLKATGGGISKLTATGNPLSFTTDIVKSLKSLTIPFTPTQDLHGQSSPWPAGGGKNLCDPSLFNASHTTESNGTYTFDGSGYTADLYSGQNGGSHVIPSDITLPYLPAGTYVWSFKYSSGGKFGSVYAVDAEGNRISLNSTGIEDSTYCAYQFTLSEASKITICRASNTTPSVFSEPQIELGTERTAYVPYSNVCPITGWTGAKVTRTGKNLFGGSVLRYGLLNSMPSAEDDTTNNRVKFTAGASVSQQITADFRFKPNTQYTFIITFSKSSGTGSNLLVRYTDETMDVIPVHSGDDVTVPATVVCVSNANKTVAYLGKRNSSGSTYLYYNESGIFEGVLTADDFVAYTGNTYAISFPALGKNLFDPSTCVEGKAIAENGNISDSTNNRYTALIPVTVGEYHVSGKNLDSTQRRIRLHGYDESGSFIRQLGTSLVNANGTFSITASIETGTAFVRMSLPKATFIENCQLERGSSATTYEPFNNTFYGGTLTINKDGSGTLADEWTSLAINAPNVSYNNSGDSTIDASYTWASYRIAKDKAVEWYANTQEGVDTNGYFNIGKWTATGELGIARAYTTKYYLVFVLTTNQYDLKTSSERSSYMATFGDNKPKVWYKVKTPTIYHLTAQQVTALLGDNTIWTDTNGSNTAVYYKSGDSA